MKKKVIAMSLASAMALSMTAVGGMTVSAADPLQVVIWDNGQQAGLQEICDLFTEETGIEAKVEVKDWSSYWTLLEAGASGGDMPDVFWMHSNNSQMYMKNDILLKLDDYIEASDVIDMSNYMSDITELYTWDGSYYAIPKDYDTIALWYNKTMFDEAGLEYPNSSWTWDDLYEAAMALTKDDGSQYGFAMNPSNDQDTYYNMVYSMGGYIVSEDHTTSGYDDENTLKAMDYVAKLLEACPSPTTMSETGTDVLLKSGTVAMICQGSWMVADFMTNDYLLENCDVAIIPYAAETGVRASICNGLGWAASAGTDRPDDCWALIEWLGSKEMQLKQAELGVTMSAYNGTSDDWVNCSDTYDLSAYLDVANESTVDGVTNELVLRPYTYNSTRWSNEAQSAFVAAWADPSTMEDVCRSFAVTMNDYIAQENN
jgi:multiple sugar transport system substrate-binding protein